MESAGPAPRRSRAPLLFIGLPVARHLWFGATLCLVGVLLGLALAGCALPQGFGQTSGTERETGPGRVVGRWEGEVDLTFPDGVKNFFTRLFSN